MVVPHLVAYRFHRQRSKRDWTAPSPPLARASRPSIELPGFERGCPRLVTVAPFQVRPAPATIVSSIERNTDGPLPSGGNGTKCGRKFFLRRPLSVHTRRDKPRQTQDISPTKPDIRVTIYDRPRLSPRTNVPKCPVLSGIRNFQEAPNVSDGNRRHRIHRQPHHP